MSDTVKPIERDEDYDRTYIPLPGGYEVQTKGRGSSFRIAWGEDDRILIPEQPYVHETLEAMARAVHAAWVELAAENARLRAALERIHVGLHRLAASDVSAICRIALGETP